MRIRKLTIIALTLVFALAAPTMAQQATAPPAAAPAAKSEVAAQLSSAELAELAEVTEAANVVTRELQTARLYLEAAERKAESAQYFGQARRLRILAKRKLDPDLWDVALVTVGPEGNQHQEWRIVPIKQAETAPKAAPASGEGTGGLP